MFKRSILFTMLLVIFISANGFAIDDGAALTLQDGKTEYDPVSCISLLEDSGNIQVSDILQPHVQKQFEPHPAHVPNFGYSSPVHWVRLPIRNHSGQTEWLLSLEYAPLDQLDLYIQQPEAAELKLLQKTGDTSSFAQREVQNRNFVFPVKLQKGQEVVLYLRVKTEGAMALPLKVLHPVRYAEREQTAYLGMGIYYGMLLIMIIYNSVLAFSFRSRAYFYYVGINTMVLFLYGTLNGLTYQYLWPEAHWWNNRAIVFFICMSHLLTMLFARNFLDGRKYFPKLYRVFTWLVVFELVNIAILFASYPIGLQVSMYSILIVDTLIIAAGLLSWRRGFRAGRIFMLGWGIFLIGAILSSLSDAGYIRYNVWTAYASQIGSALEAVILSWALAARIQQIRKEKDLAVAQMKETRHLADHDDLTGLHNRRYLVNTFNGLLPSAGAVSLLLIDVDHFKRINDTYGHDAGDSVLKRVAWLLQNCFRPSDIVGRYGGEEFLILLPETNAEQAKRAAEYVLQAVREHSFTVGNRELSCTVSIGVAQWRGDEADGIHEVIRRADEVLYKAKESGRNRVCCSE